MSLLPESDLRVVLIYFVFCDDQKFSVDFLLLFHHVQLVPLVRLHLRQLVQLALLLPKRLQTDSGEFLQRLLRQAVVLILGVQIGGCSNQRTA